MENEKIHKMFFKSNLKEFKQYLVFENKSKFVPNGLSNVSSVIKPRLIFGFPLDTIIEKGIAVKMESFVVINVKLAVLDEVLATVFHSMKRFQGSRNTCWLFLIRRWFYSRVAEVRSKVQRQMEEAVIKLGKNVDVDELSDILERVVKEAEPLGELAGAIDELILLTSRILLETVTEVIWSKKVEQEVKAFCSCYTIN